MAGIKPFFITGANAKIKLNGKTLAFCTDLSYSIQVAHQTPKVLGMYEGSSVEPLGYTVSGSFTVIRYAKDAASAIKGNRPHGVNDNGNGVGNWGSAWGGTLGDFLSRNGVGNNGRANENLDPSKLSNATTFDIQVYQRVPGTGQQADGVQNVLSSVSDILTGGTGGAGAAENMIGVANIRNCRITQADFSLSKRGAAMQRFNFVALYVDEDSFVADFSGKGQQFDV
jgi:hypothetical protein